MSQRLCYPYGAGISCTCDQRKRILRCVPVVDSLQAARGGGGLEDSLYDDLEAASLEEDLGTSKAGDERTEIILAATFLLIVILSFVAFIIHRCERNLYQRKHLGCLAAGAEPAGAVVKSLSSVSIQTVPVMGAGHFANGEISTISRVVNGGTRLQDVHCIAMEGVGVGYFRPPSIQSQDHLSPDSHFPVSPPASSGDQQIVYQDPPHQHQQPYHRGRTQEDMIETALAGLDPDYPAEDRTKM